MTTVKKIKLHEFESYMMESGIKAIHFNSIDQTGFSFEDPVRFSFLFTSFSFDLEKKRINLGETPLNMCISGVTDITIEQDEWVPVPVATLTVDSKESEHNKTKYVLLLE